MTYKCVRDCTFRSRYWRKDQIVDFGDVVPPHHFVPVEAEPTVQLVNKPKVDIMAAKPQNVKASTFYEVAKQAKKKESGFASSLEKEEVIHNPKQFKAKK